MSTLDFFKLVFHKSNIQRSKLSKYVESDEQLWKKNQMR